MEKKNANFKEKRNTIRIIRSLSFCEGFFTERARYNTGFCNIENNVFAWVICALFFSILVPEKLECVKYADSFCGGLDLGFILV
jgi:hypothetical protein